VVAELDVYTLLIPKLAIGRDPGPPVSSIHLTSW